MANLEVKEIEGGDDGRRVAVFVDWKRFGTPGRRFYDALGDTHSRARWDRLVTDPEGTDDPYDPSYDRDECPGAVFDTVADAVCELRDCGELDRALRDGLRGAGDGEVWFVFDRARFASLRGLVTYTG